MLTIDSDLAVLEKEQRGTEICACGHQGGKHIAVATGVICDGARQSCPCRTWHPVVEVPDVRVFMYGPSAQGHPLVMGLLRTRQRERWDEVVMIRENCEIADCDREWKTAEYVEDGRRSRVVCEVHGE